MTLSSTPRVFVADALLAGRVCVLEGAPVRHLAIVLRRGPGDALRLFNGADGEWAGRIASLRRERMEIAVETMLHAQDSPPDLRLVLALLKREAMEWAVEKATELGAAAILPVITRRSVPDRVNTDRLAAIAQAAATQSERLTLPRIEAARPLHALLDAWDGAALLVAAERRDAPPLLRAALGRAPPAGLLIGPEGGFDRAELDDALNRPFVAPVGLGPRILRAETACVAGFALLAAAIGDNA